MQLLRFVQIARQERSQAFGGEGMGETDTNPLRPVAAGVRVEGVTEFPGISVVFRSWQAFCKEGGDMKPSVLIIVNKPESFSRKGHETLHSFFESLQEKCWLYVSHHEVGEISDWESGVRLLPLRDGVCEIFGNLSLVIVILPSIERCFVDFEGDADIPKWSEFMMEGSDLEGDLEALETRCTEFLGLDVSSAEAREKQPLVA